MAELYLGNPLPPLTGYRPEISGSQGAVTSNVSYATQAGLSILQQGGNAVDAAVAVSLALGVVDPHNSGIGGGSFTVLYSARDGQYYAVDARGVTPCTPGRTCIWTKPAAPTPL